MAELAADFIGTNSFLLSHYGNVMALGFKGTKEFIEKAYNLSYNHSITDGRLISLEDNFSYVLTTREKLEIGLKNYFINEIKVNNIVPLLKDEWVETENEDSDGTAEYIIEYNEPAIDQLAQEKTQKFILDTIKEDNFMTPVVRSGNNEYYEVRGSFAKKSFGVNYLQDSKDQEGGK